MEDSQGEQEDRSEVRDVVGEHLDGANAADGDLYGLVTVVGGGPLDYHEGGQRWTDWFARQDLSELWGSVARVELNPPLYYMLLHVWTDLFGESVLAMRSLSAMIDCLTIPLVYLTCRWSLPRNAGHYVGLVAAIFGHSYSLFIKLRYSNAIDLRAPPVINLSEKNSLSREVTELNAAISVPPKDLLE